MDKYTGKKLDGRYEIRELIGVGGMANVYHCYDTIDAREVAIKILKDEFLDNEDFIRRFKNESKAIAVLNHPNIVRVYDVSFGDMIQYIVMEYIDGITLKEYIDMQGVLDWKETVHLTTQILKALQHAHENGIIHRDIKPHNIMLLQDGTIKVTDFGIARFSSNATRTMTEQAIGSVHYIAPEQARGEKTDGKTDIYSVGVMMYEMLTGQLPFDADSAVSVALMQLQAKARRPREVNPSIPEGLEEITVKAMQKNPDDRYHSALEMLSDIERFRLNPSIRFEYRYYEDKPKYNEAVRKHKNSKLPAPAQEEPDTAADYDDDAPVRSPVLAGITGVIIAAVLALVIFAGLALLKGYNSTKPQDLDIPNFVGMTVKEANELNAGQFTFTYVNRYSDSLPIDSIIEQSPTAGSKRIRRGASIELVINSADSEVKVPYVNSSIGTEEIVSRIESLNLIPKVFYVESDKAAGKVDSVYPAVGTSVKIGSTVYVFISNGVARPDLTLPDLTYYTLEGAKTRLKELGFTNIVVEYDELSKADKDTVVRQNPVQGSVLAANQKITLICSYGAQPEKTHIIPLDLPATVTDEVEMTVLVNDVIDHQNSMPIIPAYNTEYALNITADETVTVLVLLNDEKYREYSVDYDTGEVTLLQAYHFSGEPYEEVTESGDHSDFDDESGE